MYVSDIVNFSLLSKAYEDVESAAYPLVLLDNEANNKLMLKNQKMIEEMVNIGKQLLENPIQYEDGSLILFGISILNHNESTQRKFGSFVSTIESKLELLRHPKCKNNLFNEIGQCSREIFFDAINGRQSKSCSSCSSCSSDHLPIDDLGHLLGVAIIAKNGFDEFFMLRKNNRNFILKALRYILLEEKSMHNEVLPSLYEIKEKNGLKNTTGCFNFDFIKSVYKHYGLIDDSGFTYPSLINSFERAAIYCRQRKPQCAVFLELFKNDQLLPAFVAASESKPFQLEHLFFWLMRNPKKELNQENINFYVDVLQSDFSVEKYLNIVDEKFSDGDAKGILDDMLRIEQMRDKGVSFLDLMLPAYLEFSANYKFDIFAAKFLSEFILSKHYVHSDQAYQKLKSIISLAKWEDRDNSLISILNGQHAFFSTTNEYLKISEKNKAFWNRLLRLIINTDDALENWKFFLENKKLMNTQCLSLDNKTYEQALVDCDTFGEFRRLLEEHNPILSEINNMRMDEFFAVCNRISSFKAGCVKPICTKTEYRKLHRNSDFSELLTLKMVTSSAHFRSIPIPAVLGKAHLIIIVPHWYSGTWQYCLLDIVTKGEVEPAVALEALRIVQFLNKNVE